MSESQEGSVEMLIRSISVRVLWVYVLAVLKDEPTYPYRVKGLIKDRFSFNAPTVTLYTIMYRLEKKGLIARDEKGIYRITEQGLKALAEAAQALKSIAQRVSEAATASSTELQYRQLVEER